MSVAHWSPDTEFVLYCGTCPVSPITIRYEYALPDDTEALYFVFMKLAMFVAVVPVSSV